MPQTGSRDTHHHGNLKEALVEYAIGAADRGRMTDLSLRQAARDLGVSPGAAYRHFPDKDALLETVAQRGFDALAESFENVLPFDSQARDADEARRRFVALAQAYAEFALNRTELWRLMFGPLGLASGRISDRPSTYQWLTKALEELAEHGVIIPPQADHTFFAWSVVHGLSDLQHTPAIAGQSLESMVERQCRLILAALAARR